MRFGYGASLYEHRLEGYLAFVLFGILKHPCLVGVAVCRAVQAPGEFIITFPRAYHAGFSNGFCIGEAANFATGNWFSHGAEAIQRYCRLQHPIMFSPEYLLCTEARNLICTLSHSPSFSIEIRTEISLCQSMLTKRLECGISMECEALA